MVSLIKTITLTDIDDTDVDFRSILRTLAKHKLCINIEGNIGTGKTTLTNKLANIFREEIGESNVVCIIEEMDDFALELLDKFNEDPKTWAIKFQLFMDERRLKNMELASQMKSNFGPNGGIILMDTGTIRHYVFSMVNKDRNNITDDDFNKHMEYFSDRLKVIDKPDIILIIDTPVDTLMENIKFRNRSSESNLDASYLEDIRRNYIKAVYAYSMDYADPNNVSFIHVSTGSTWIDPNKLIQGIYKLNRLNLKTSGCHILNENRDK